ncbi:hypothetical protein ADH76_23450 [Enterocloster clostridioformis]|uniref:hypothetical protein n=1 Tax=Enterocloster clostridioformis TaxID=1531 RepID=UPI00080C36E1|nr:hypothetical protein [Enterocloster clostridioformis]ANU46507.1 hypothetical protein A4V08_12580 [Lachnoclostridium sp. YL32]NDO31367.1 hypothetical protein [Enterocloster clostridioformis]OXE65220.1 hypothetical protein ADH76_23450 [Enterocloster clostridioformis]QQQ98779.1 hypothetical protein I5Q83_21985 [Enterocloster clostridioformis]
MSKQYYLVSSNSEPTPGLKEKELILNGVNAYDIKELVRLEEDKRIFIIKDENIEFIKDRNESR